MDDWVDRLKQVMEQSSHGGQDFLVPNLYNAE